MKVQVVAVTPHKTVYAQLGTLTQILPTWELIKNVTSHKGEHKQFLSPLLSSDAISFFICPLSLRAHAHSQLSRGSATRKK